MKVTLDDLLTAFYLHGLDSRFDGPRDNLIMMDEITMSVAVAKLSTLKNFHDAVKTGVEEKESSTPVVRTELRSIWSSGSAEHTSGSVMLPSVDDTDGLSSGVNMKRTTTPKEYTSDFAQARRPDFTSGAL